MAGFYCMTVSQISERPEEMMIEGNSVVINVTKDSDMDLFACRGTIPHHPVAETTVRLKVAFPTKANVNLVTSGNGERTIIVVAAGNPHFKGDRNGRVSGSKGC